MKAKAKKVAKVSAPPKEEIPQTSNVHDALNRKATVEIAKPVAAGSEQQ